MNKALYCPGFLFPLQQIRWNSGDCAVSAKNYRAMDKLATLCWRIVSEPLCVGVRVQCNVVFCIQMCFDTSNNSLQSVIIVTRTSSEFLSPHKRMLEFIFENVSFIVFVTHEISILT